MSRPSPHLPLLAATFVLAVSGLVYELLAGTVSAYLLGSSVYQFSIVIGLFMSAMGIGAWLSRHVDDAEGGFVIAQIALGLIGGCSALLLFLAYTLIASYDPFLILLCVVTGTLVGLEIPLVIRILEAHRSLRINISNVLTVDYLGALAAAALFPLILVPQLGLIQTGLVFGALNLLVAGLALWLFGRWRLVTPLALASILVVTALAFSGRLTTLVETRLLDAEIVYAETTPYQRIVLTRSRERFQLFINGNLQFDTIDEHRYHEALVHPAMIRAARVSNVLVLGGGDGLVVRELLRYDDVESITLVDLDPAMTKLFRERAELAELNDRSLSDPRVQILNEDAWQFLDHGESLFDVVIADLPDPHGLDLSKLYSLEFYTMLAMRLGRDGVVVTQATSPLFAREAFWSIEATLSATATPFAVTGTLETMPYHAYVPSFGDWGFIIAASRLAQRSYRELPSGLRYVDAGFLERAQIFENDIERVPVEVNSILEHALVGYYEEGWRRWFGP